MLYRGQNSSTKRMKMGVLTAYYLDLETSHPGKNFLRACIDGCVPTAGIVPVAGTAFYLQNLTTPHWRKFSVSASLKPRLLKISSVS